MSGLNNNASITVLIEGICVKFILEIETEAEKVSGATIEQLLDSAKASTKNQVYRPRDKDLELAANTVFEEGKAVKARFQAA